MICGVGTDIVEIDRLEAVLARRGDAFKRRVFTPMELALAIERGGGVPTLFFAGRWAAKEAASKALGCGIGGGCAFTDLEILNGRLGAPELTFHGAAAETLARKGGTRALLSISHERHYAVATVIIIDDKS